MKSRYSLQLSGTVHSLAGVLACLAVAILSLHPAGVFAQATAVTYQGRLSDYGASATGSYGLPAAFDCQ